MSRSFRKTPPASLSAGDEFVIETPGAVVVQAFAPAVTEFGPCYSQETLEQYLFDRGGRAA